MKRRSFLTRLGANFLLIGLGASSLSGCGSGSGSGGSDGPSEGVADGTCSTGAGVSEPDPIHSHDNLSLSSDEVADTTPRPIQLLSGDHPHWYNFTTQDFIDLQNDLVVTKDLADLDSGPSHDHILKISC